MKRFAFASLCALLAVAFVALGLWQLERRGWKRDLIARVESRMRAPPRPLPHRGSWNGDLAYTRVFVTGELLHEKETLVQAATVLGAGWWVLTPLRTETGIVLVNRGFVPPERRTPASRQSGQVQGRVTLTGLIRASEPGGAFLRSNDARADRWYSRDVSGIARARSLGPVAPFFVDADAAGVPGGYPIGGMTRIVFRDNHLAYALTWLVLAGLSLSGLAVIALQRSERR